MSWKIKTTKPHFLYPNISTVLSKLVKPKDCKPWSPTGIYVGVTLFYINQINFFGLSFKKYIQMTAW